VKNVLAKLRDLIKGKRTKHVGYAIDSDGDVIIIKAPEEPQVPTARQPAVPTVKPVALPVRDWANAFITPVKPTGNRSRKERRATGISARQQRIRRRDAQAHPKLDARRYERIMDAYCLQENGLPHGTTTKADYKFATLYADGLNSAQNAFRGER
jgi:hypothetical protein